VVAPFQTPGPEDVLLLELIEQGDVDSMARLYDAHARVVYSVAVKVLRDASAAEDVLQDVFLRLWRSPSTFKPARGSLGGWLAVIARNRAIDILRRRKNTDSVDDLLLPSSSDPAKDVEQSLLVDRLRPLLARLPEAQRVALDMSFFRGMTHAEIAEATHTPLGTVKSRVRSALLSIGKGIRG
jgi:RNA polymerase sigma-70 factor (ECF subfamily)